MAREKKKGLPRKKAAKSTLKLKLLVVVRHGHYDDDYKLSQYGRERVRRLAEKLKSKINSNSILLLSSVAKRASQSADVISKVLGVPFEEHEILWAENRHPEDIPGLLQFIKARKNEAEVMILVTHLEYACSFPFHFAHSELGMDTLPPSPEKGEAFLINCLDRSFELLE